MSNTSGRGPQKPHILGQPHSLSNEEAQNITEMILEAQGSSRQLTIPAEDLDEQATTKMSPEVEHVISKSHVLDILQRFNRDYLYGLGRFDEYRQGVLLKWGDGYSRKHIWVTVEGDHWSSPPVTSETAASRSVEAATCLWAGRVARYSPHQQ